ncbi:glycosyltransferase family 4 protein [Acetobacteraceae bacterium ESL0709]|nr:glycosyltransferase family 4 protein [Acetobacteraceae bacterium ESL0709]
MRVALLALGLAEKNDSVCNDIVWQYHFLKTACLSVNEVRIFSGCYKSSSFPDIPVESIDNFKNWLQNDPDIIVIFHYCDSTTPYDEFLREKCHHLIIRWHNSTPPWFTFGIQNNNALHSLLGYENIIRYIDCPSVVFWANSEFTKEQLIALGMTPERCQIVYPASRYLDMTLLAHDAEKPFSPKESLKLLFVSRVVAHKGHANLIALADRVKEIINRPVQLHIVGKGLDDPNNFSKQLLNDIKEARSEVIIHGLIDDNELINLYKTSDVFVCLSEHEGFGLPVFEAMYYRLPVVCWAITSFCALLRKHPFAFESFDLDLLASAVMSLMDNDVREYIISLQNEIVSSYNSSGIKNQISNAISNYIVDTMRNVRKNFSSSGAYIEEIIDKNRKFLMDSRYGSYEEGIPFDSHGNIVSLYDLSIYNQFIEQQERLIGLLTCPISSPRVSFEPDEFSLRKGVIPYSSFSEGYTPEISEIPPQHIIFGPYVQMPKGDYIATLKIDIFNALKHKVSFEIDLQSGEKQLTRRVVTVGPGKVKLEKHLNFAIMSENSLVELRLQPKEKFRGYIVFYGAEFIKKQKNQGVFFYEYIIK